jgi:uncharacterized membrane protein YbhN (UPF0104 family)
VNQQDAVAAVSPEMEPESGASTTARLGNASQGWQGRRRIVEIAVFAALIAGAVVTLPGLGDLRDRLAGADLGLILLVAAVEVGSCLAFVTAFRGVFSRRLGWRFAYEVGMAEQAANVLMQTGGAGGLALGAWALRRVGMPAERIGRRTVAFFLVTSSINFFAVVLAGAAVGLGIMPGERAMALALVPAAITAIAIVGIVLLPRFLDGAGPTGGGRLRTAIAAGRGHLAGGIRDAVALLGGRPTVTFGAIGYMGLDVAALALAFAALGGGAPAVGAFVLAYAVGQLGGLVPLPGGVGGTDGGLILAFGLLGTPVAVAGAAVIAYRVFQLGVPALLGLAAFAQLRRSLAQEPGEPGPEPCFEAGARRRPTEPCLGSTVGLEPHPA